ncbi:glutathione-dependent formaldehyde-activating enzyme [Schizopora paradoxa]|uniref:Glutathione-dependent formaldehyde-activating enzyme n=1 Tax=Schizopora paradoxa TaxID=27342 RepID=A0A0H2RZX9_9AGAM|nr:glutathione-dependent formaldehyde-activating enzyme [Schizopora paradoxa]
MSTTTTNEETVHYKGSCHCKKFEFEFDVPKITKAHSCNCSICHQKATVYHFMPLEKVKFTKSSFKEASAYQFGQKRYKHMFCPVCGCSPFGTDNDEKGGAINLRAVEGIKLKELEITEIDGASL